MAPTPVDNLGTIPWMSLGCDSAGWAAVREGGSGAGWEGCARCTRVVRALQPACRCRRQWGKCRLTDIFVRLWIGKRRFIVLECVSVKLCV